MPRLLKKRTRSATKTSSNTGDGTNIVDEKDNNGEQNFSKKVAIENSKVKSSNRLLPTVVSEAQKSEKNSSINETKSSQTKKKNKDSQPIIKLKVLKTKSTADKVSIKGVADEFATSANENDGIIDNERSPMVIQSATKNDSENSITKKPKLFSNLKANTKEMSSNNLENSSSSVKKLKVILPQDKSTESTAKAEESSRKSLRNLNKQLKKITKNKTIIPSILIGKEKTTTPVDIGKVKTETNPSLSKELKDVKKEQETEKSHHTPDSSNIKHEILQKRKLAINKQLSNIGKQPTNVQNSTLKTQLLQSKKILINKQLNNVGRRLTTSPKISLQRVKKEKKLKGDSLEQKQQSPEKINKNLNKQQTTSTIKNKQTVNPSSTTDKSTGSDVPGRKKEQIDSGKVKNEKAAAAVATTNDKLKCNRCDQIFIHTFEKIIHKKSVKGDGVPFVCEICNFRSCTKDGLVIHQRAEHHNDTK